MTEQFAQINREMLNTVKTGVELEVTMQSLF